MVHKVDGSLNGVVILRKSSKSHTFADTTR